MTPGVPDVLEGRLLAYLDSGLSLEQQWQVKIAPNCMQFFGSLGINYIRSTLQLQAALDEAIAAADALLLEANSLVRCNQSEGLIDSLSIFLQP